MSMSPGVGARSLDRQSRKFYAYKTTQSPMTRMKTLKQKAAQKMFSMEKGFHEAGG